MAERPRRTWPRVAPPSRTVPRVPGEAALAVVAPLAHGEHAGVGRAGEEELAHVEGPQRPEPPALALAAEALQAAAALGAHAGGAAAARCGARASPEGGRREGGQVCLRRPPAFKELGAPLGAGAVPWPRPGARGGRAVRGCAGRARGSPPAPAKLRCPVRKAGVPSRPGHHPLCPRPH